MRKIIFITVFLVPVFTAAQDTGKVYSKIWGKQGELWNKSRLPDFTKAGYKKGRESIPNLPVSVNIIDFGGKGDGVTDNTGALRATINHCAKNGTVYIPEGTYVLSDTILIKKSGVCIRGSGKNTVIYFSKGIEELYPHYGIEFIKQTVWSWSGALITFQGKINNVGIEHLTIKFPDNVWAGHNFHERAYNALGFSEGAHDGWLNDVTIIGCDLGIWIESSAHHITLENWSLQPGPERSAQPITGHHGVNVYGGYNLLQHFRIDGKFQHDLSVEGTKSQYNVFRDGSGKDLCIDHHNHEQSHNLFTHLDMGLATRPYFSGGVATPRGISFKEVYWNLSGNANIPFCDQFDDQGGHSKGNICVGIKNTIPSGGTNNNWFENIKPKALQPQDLYGAQMQYHGFQLLQ